MTDSDSSSSSDRDFSRVDSIHSEPVERENDTDRWSLLRTRITDPRTWPGSWWQQLPEKINLSDEDLRRQHDEISRTIAKSLAVLVALAAFFELALGAPDAYLIARDATIKLPVAETEIYFATFLVVGPLILIAFSLYLQILVGYWVTLSRQLESAHSGLPFVFNLRGRAAGYFSNFLFYWLVPIILVSFAWKGLPRQEAPWPIFFFGTATCALLFLQVCRRSDRPLQGGSIVLLLAAAATACITIFAVASLLLGQGLISRPLNLAKADLSKQEVRGVNFSGADLLGANLVGAHLEGANLTGAFLGSADLKWADLQKARMKGALLMGANVVEANLTETHLEGADLKEAYLNKADLEGAHFEGASLIHTRLKEANLKGALFGRANLYKADLRDTDMRKADLTGANLTTAYLKGANLEEANLTGAVLEHANLSGVNLRGANLSLAQMKGAKLTGTNLQDANLQGADLTDTAKTFTGEPNLTQQQINSAHGDAKTKLPPEIVAPDSWKR